MDGLERDNNFARLLLVGKLDYWYVNIHRSRNTSKTPFTQSLLYAASSRPHKRHLDIPSPDLPPDHRILGSSSKPSRIDSIRRAILVYPIRLPRLVNGKLWTGLDSVGLLDVDVVCHCALDMHIKRCVCAELVRV